MYSGIRSHNVLLLNPFSDRSPFQNGGGQYSQQSQSTRVHPGHKSGKICDIIKGGHITLFVPLTSIHVNANLGDRKWKFM